MKKLLIICLAFALTSFVAEAQISAGVNMFSSNTFVTIGSNPDKPLFGEGRISTGGNVDLELMGGYNLVQKEDVNFYLGMALGIWDNRRDNDFYVGIPFGLLVKPFGGSKNLGLVLEAAPIFPGDNSSYFRAGFGFKYTFR